MNTTILRVLIGFLVAPFVPALIVYALSIAGGSSRGEATWSLEIFAAIGYVAVLILGVPAYLMFRARGVTGYMPYLSMGALIGLSCVVLGFLPYLFFGRSQSNPEEAITLLRTAMAVAVPAIVGGAIGSTVFWLIAVRRLSS